jgi:hypothetical protein
LTKRTLHVAFIEPIVQTVVTKSVHA